MADTGQKRVSDILKTLSADLSSGEGPELMVTAPGDGDIIATIRQDNPHNLDQKLKRARSAQAAWASHKREHRAALLEKLAAAIKLHRDRLGELITLEAGKTVKEGQGEADSSSDVITKTLKDAALAEFSGMLRTKERPPVGVVGLITSFNFPLVVANWTIAPAMLAGNAVLWKPSEKTPLVARAYKAIFDEVMELDKDLLQIITGTREIGEAMVKDEHIDMVSATGSVAMGQGIKAALDRKKNNEIHPILELGGNNGVIISEKISPEHLEWSVNAILNSFFGTAGQRCTNTRRLIVHKTITDKVVNLLTQKIEQFVASGAIVNPLLGASNEYGYGPLIDVDAFSRFENAKMQVATEGGHVLLGKRLLTEEYKQAYYVEPALALMSSHSHIMHEETFGPILFITTYDHGIDQALHLLNLPTNAGLVSGIYTQNQAEADRFAQVSEAGHVLINSPKGTGTPAFGMGFGGNKASGEGEILNAADPLRPFTRDDKFSRIAQNKDIKMDH